MPSISLMDKLPTKNETLANWIYMPVLFLIVILLGNYEIFLGHSFIVNEPNHTIFRYFAENMKSSGWRPDMGLGMTFFYGDPGTFHTWAPFRWWGHLFPSPLLAFNIAILIILWASCLSLHTLLKTAVPNLNQMVTFSLACLIAFGSLRHATFFFQSYWGTFPILIPIISLLVYSFSKKPTIKHYFLYTLTLTLSLVLGSVLNLLLSVIYSAAFFIAIIFFNDWHKKWESLFKWCGRFVLLNTATGASILVLAGWTLYSIFLESQITGYVRDGNYGSSSAFFLSPSITFFFQRIMEYVQPGIFSPWTSFLGIQQTLAVTGENCVSPFFPIMALIFLLYKTRNLWEYTTKFLLFGFILYQEFILWTPGFTQYLQNTLHLRPLSHFQPTSQVLGIVGFGICLSRIHSGDLQVKKKGALLIRALASVLTLLYASLLFVALFSIFAPETLTSMFLGGWSIAAHYINSLSLRELGPTLISENVKIFHETMGLSSIFFYGSTLAIMILFAIGKGVDLLRWKQGTIFAGILVFNQIFLAWTSQPLNHEPLFWDSQIINEKKLSTIFSPTDRIMRVGVPFCKQNSGDYYNCVKKKFFGGDYGPKRWRIGHMYTPALELSKAKSFTQNEVSEFIQTLIKIEKPTWRYPYGFHRRLQRGPPLYSSKYYDIVGVKYLVSMDPIPASNRIKLIHSNRQFYLYKYLGAWPYYYLANRIETIETYADMYYAERGAAYIWENEPTVPLVKENIHAKKIHLKNFQYGRFEFEYESKEPEFLVVSDAWHPYWQAKINGIETNIIKTNGVFKGISLPPGKGVVELFFNNSPYKPGIWISIYGWTLFLGGWILYNLKSTQLPK